MQGEPAAAAVPSAADPLELPLKVRLPGIVKFGELNIKPAFPPIVFAAVPKATCVLAIVPAIVPPPPLPPPLDRAEAMEVMIETVEVPPTRVDIRTLMRVNAAVLNCHQPVPVVELV